MRTRDIEKEELVKQKTMELVVKDGLEGFSVNKLAKACGISVATLYIYYKDKDDLITTIAIEESKIMTACSLKDFDPEMSFAAGLKLQWKNRYKYMMEHPYSIPFFELLRTSTYEEKVFATMNVEFKKVMGKFMDNAVKKGEINRMPLEVYWSIAFSPLYSLAKIHQNGKSIGGHHFTISDKIVWQTYDLVLKALTP